MTIKFLTESTLGDFLNHLSDDWVHDKKVPGCVTNYRPDYRSDTLKLIVEFDGYLHYTKTKSVVRDISKFDHWNMLGYDVIRIPYFVQLSSQTIKLYFMKDVEWEQSFPHGFISDNCVLPADFCALGTERFNRELNNLPENIKQDIMDSLDAKTLAESDPLVVWPHEYAIGEYNCSVTHIYKHY